MVETLGQTRVAPPEDVKFSKHHDMLLNHVFERKKQEAKKLRAKLPYVQLRTGPIQQALNVSAMW